MKMMKRDISLEERRREFKQDGSCTDKCQWGYGIVRETGLCICLDDCREEFTEDVNEKEKV